MAGEVRPWRGAEGGGVPPRHPGAETAPTPPGKGRERRAQLLQGGRAEQDARGHDADADDDADAEDDDESGCRHGDRERQDVHVVPERDHAGERRGVTGDTGRAGRRHGGIDTLQPDDTAGDPERARVARRRAKAGGETGCGVRGQVLLLHLQYAGRPSVAVQRVHRRPDDRNRPCSGRVPAPPPARVAPPLSLLHDLWVISDRPALARRSPDALQTLSLALHAAPFALQTRRPKRCCV